MVEDEKKYGPKYITITIRTTDGSTLQGRVNIASKKRVSDLFTDSSEQFIVMINVSSRRGSDKTLFVNTETEDVEQAEDVQELSPEDSYLSIEYAIRASSYNARVKKLNDNVYVFDVEAFRPVDGAVEITFNTAKDGLFYSAGAGEHVAVEIPTDLKHDPAFALSNGFIYLGDGYSLVKDCSVEHIAATWKQKEQKLVFRQELNKKNPKMNMRFYIVKGDVNAGLKFGNELNTWPSYYVSYKGDELDVQQFIPVK